MLLSFPGDWWERLKSSAIQVMLHDLVNEIADDTNVVF
jgi:hypothetical protein